MKNVIIIPTLEPGQKLINLVNDLKKIGFKYIVVIDDGSGEKYHNIFTELEKNNCKVFHHNKNFGKGEGIKTGIKKAKELYPDITGYITADSDGQHKASDILKISDELNRFPSSIILGTRYFCKNTVPFKSYYGNKFSSIFFKLETGVDCCDTQTGLRGIPVELTSFALSIPGSRYEYEMNFLITAAKEKKDIRYISIETIYENNNEVSHFRPFKDAIIIYKTPLKFMISSCLSAIIDLTLFTIFAILMTFKYDVILATIFARILSGIFNYIINKHWSFRNNKKDFWQAFKYGLLFVFQMTLSASLLYIFSFLPLYITCIKVIIDVSLFILSYIIQKNHIFNDRS